MRRNLLFLPLLFLLILAFPSAVQADGIIIPNPPICDPCPPPPCPGPMPCPPPSPMTQLAIRYHRVNVTIEDQVAVTRVDQVFYNPNDWAVEGTYVFPLPRGAAVSAFTLWIDGQPVEGEVLEAAEARQIYQDIVSRLRDPALLEYAGQQAVQAHIFPIPPQGERRVELEYTQALTAENGLVRYVYPLNTEKFSAWPLENVAVNVDVRSSSPIRAVYSPSHNVSIGRENENHVTAGYEAADVLPDTDFALYYSLGEEQAFHLLTYRDPTHPDDPDGFFLLMLAPRPEAPEQTIAKDVLLVLDRSGSMEGEKFQQAQEALRYVLRHLNPEDRFNLIVFSTDLEPFATGLRPASEAQEAIDWVDSLSAQGSTDINRALLDGAAMIAEDGEPGRPAYLIFLTDGLPTSGEVENDRILANLAASAPEQMRLFVFGVGYDVDTFLLDSLAQAHHGASTYVLPQEMLDEVLSAFYAKVSTPVLTDLTLDFGRLAVYDLYPSPLPDLFRGSQILLTGRYREPGTTDVTLTGYVNNEPQTYVFPGEVFAENSLTQGPEASLPRLWATRKIGHLLNQVRLEGPNQETIDQIVRLSIRYGIVTPYTSYLVTEPSPLGADEQARIVEEQFNELQSAPAEPASGQAAVEKAAGQGEMADASAPAASSAETANRVRTVGARTFVLSGSQWVDTAFDPDRMQTVKVAFLSDDYFALAAFRPELAAAFALGPSVVAISDGTAYEVAAEDASVAPVDVPPTHTPAVFSSNPNQPAETPAVPAQVPPGQITETPPAAEAFGLPCAAGLLPLGLLLVGLWLRRPGQ